MRLAGARPFDGVGTPQTPKSKQEKKSDGHLLSLRLGILQSVSHVHVLVARARAAPPARAAFRTADALMRERDTAALRGIIARSSPPAATRNLLARQTY